MVTTVTSNFKRTPLLPSEPDNGGNFRRPKAREVTSRYLSSSSSNSSLSSSSNTTTSSSSSTARSLPAVSSKMCQSPVVTRMGLATPRNTERAISADRRRPVRVDATPSNAERMLVKSMRSLSVSFQGELFPSKVKTAAIVGGGGTAGGVGLRKGTPERRKLGVTPVRERESSRPSDQQQQRWPGRSRGEHSNIMSQGVDYGAERTKLSGFGTAKNELRKSIRDENNRYNFHDKRTNKLDTGSNPSVPVTSDIESVSSDGVESRSVSQPRGGKCGIVVPARIWQESNRFEKLADLSSPRSIISGLSRTTGPSKLTGAKKFLNEKNPISSPRGLSPLRAGTRPSSPSKLSMLNSTPLRGMESPTRVRNGVGTVLTDNSMLPMMSFLTDARRGKLVESRIADAHDLRLLYNRRLQWQFVNARAEKVLLVQKERAERRQYNAWISITKLWHSVKCKRIQLQLLRRNLKLYSILQGQEPYLEHWDLINVDHCKGLSGAKEALEASTIRLPVVGGARGNVQGLEEAISSAVDVMQAMASSICSLLTKVEQMNLLVSGLANLSAREHRLLDECKDFLSSKFLPLQVMHCSLRTQLLQLQHAHSSLTRKE